MQKSYHRLFSWVVVAFIALGTFSLYWIFENRLQTDKVALFNRATENIKIKLNENLHDCTKLMSSIYGLYTSSKSVEYAEWNTFLSEVNLHDEYPYVDSMWYMPRITASNLDDFKKRLIEANVKPLEIGNWEQANQEKTQNPPPSRNEFFPIEFLYSSTNNSQLELQTLDVLSHPILALALQKSILTGKESVSDVILLNGVPKVVLFKPVHYKNQAANLTHTPMMNVEGELGIVIDFSKLLFANGFATNNQIDVDVFSGKNISKDALVFDSAPEYYDNKYFESRYVITEELSIVDKNLTFRFKSKPGFENQVQSHLPIIILLLGLLLALIVYNFISDVGKTWESGINHGKVVLKIALVLFTLEMLIMVVMNIFTPFFHTHGYVSSILDACILTISASIVIYTWILRPLDVKLSQKIDELNTDIALRIETENELRESENRYKLAIKAARDGVWDWPISSDFGWWSTEFYEILGYQNKEILSSLHFFKNLIHPEDHFFTSQCEAWLLGEKGSLNTEMRIKHKDGHFVWVHCCGELSCDEQGKPSRISGTLSDINKLKQNEIELKQTQELLLQSQRLESLGKLAGGVAHDFNNILGGILGYASLLLGKFEGDAVVTRKLNIIKDSAKRGAELSQQLLGFARKGRYEIRNLALNNIATEVTTLLTRSVEKNIKIILNLDPQLQPIDGDSTQLFQVIMNLCVNARDAMKTGGELVITTKNIHVTNDTREDFFDLNPGNYAQLIVSDTGEGIAPEVIDKIFDPFFTTKEMGKGSGLGLSMVYGIIQNHKGIVKVVSNKGHGTKFIIALPTSAYCLSEKISSHQNTQSTIGKAESCHKAGDFLIADDEANLLDLAAEIVGEGFPRHRIHLATNGGEAVRIFENFQNIKTVVMDVAMPEMDGLTAFHQIKKINAEVQFVFLSGYSEDEAIAKLRNDTTNKVRFLQKPYKPQDLLDEISLGINSPNI